MNKRHWEIGKKHPLGSSENILQYREHPYDGLQVWNPWCDRWQKSNESDSKGKEMLSYQDTWMDYEADGLFEEYP